MRILYGEKFATVITKCNYIAGSEICGAKSVKFYIWTDPWSVSFISRCEAHVNYRMSSLEQANEVTYEEALVWDVLES